MKIYCCKEHVELALDVFVDEEETFPALCTVDNPNDLSTTCEYCSSTSAYIVENA
ncbi:CxxH/CxxC protein [Jeotgalibacillus sp. S-D1]|uniref:CxxH/CxxC protein n=1 Tax=Jeotgalibacillus sp. S-D1 TaxID=2552189 RepID=UPI001059D1E0|nr:CxxH/CxxC protein [Jeotgalibacillus sp. S-D1]TDL32025.1 CxxH/CxxC protein [Jeotgalibacillus sp. S-D1]